MAIRKRGKRFVVEVRIKGHTPIYRTFNTKLEAQSFEIEQKILISRGQQLIQKTFTQTAQRFLEEIAPSYKCYKQARRYLTYYQNHWLGSLIVSEINERDIERYVEELKQKKLKDGSILRELKLLSSLFNQSIRWRYGKHNPVKSARKPKNPPHRKRRITSNEIQSIIQALGYYEGQKINNQKSALAIAFLLAIETGLRQGEIYHLEWENVYFDQHYIHVKTSKNGDSRDVPLSIKAEQLLWQMYQSALHARLVFPYSKASSASLFSQTIKHLAIHDLHFHDTRHEACSRLARIQGMDTLKLAKIIGHRDPKSLMIYFNPHAHELVELIRK